MSGRDLDDDSEMLGGEKEIEAYRQSMAVKRAIHMQLGHRYGPRWSIPECKKSLISQCSGTSAQYTCTDRLVQCSGIYQSL